jgi:hypothetical protein
MNKHVILLSAAAVLLFSCARKADNDVIRPGEIITFTASWNGSDDTRTVLQSNGTSVWWDASEQINVFFSDKASGKFISTNSEPQAIVDFQGSLPIMVGSVETDNPAHAYWAVYPYNVANTCDGESVTLFIPSTQTAVEGTFANKMFPSIATSKNFYLSFYNICGGVRFTVANDGICSVTFKSNNGESLAGKVQVGFDDVPVIKNVIEGESEIIVNAPDGGFIPGKYYFATLLPQTLTKGVSLTFDREDGKTASISLDPSITIHRSRFGKLEEKDKDLEFIDGGSGHNPSYYIDFADPYVKKVCVSKFDTNGDGEISFNEAMSVTTLGETFFGTYQEYVTSFDELQYFTSITSLGGAFKECKRLKSVTLPSSITSLNTTFFNCEELECVNNLDEPLSSIGPLTFYNCKKIRGLTIPNTVRTIGEYAFYYCELLTDLTVPEGITIIERDTFAECHNLTNIALPNSLEVIGSYAFRYCAFSDISIPNNVFEIQACAFEGCQNLSSISIPPSVRSLKESIFCNSGLKSIYIPETVLYFAPCVLLQADELEYIDGPYASSDHRCLVVDGVLNSMAVKGLTEYTTPPEVVKIGTACLQSYSSPITKIEISEGVTEIGEDAFYYSSLSVAYLPSTLTKIGFEAFGGTNTYLQLYCKAINPPEISDLFKGQNSTVYVPRSSVELYKSDSGWSKYASRIVGYDY